MDGARCPQRLRATFQCVGRLAGPDLDKFGVNAHAVRFNEPAY
jgi:hypothetical protein